MANEIEKVRPGEVISSDLMNQIITKLNELEKKVSTLPPGNGGPGGPPSIQLFFTPSQGQNVGAEMSVLGSFDFPPSLNTVTMDGLSITEFRDGSNLTTLKFLVPESFNVPVGTTKSVAVRVVNSKGIGEAQYMLKEKLQQSAPTPTITAVTNQSNPQFGPLLQTGQSALITGTNFSPTPSENSISITVPSTTAGVNTTVPVPTGNILSISGGRDLLVFTVPDIPNMGTVGTQKNGTLELLVTGNNISASEGITVIRMQPAS